jgi:hypothetical protein
MQACVAARRATEDKPDVAEEVVADAPDADAPAVDGEAPAEPQPEAEPEKVRGLCQGGSSVKSRPTDPASSTAHIHSPR